MLCYFCTFVNTKGYPSAVRFNSVISYCNPRLAVNGEVSQVRSIHTKQNMKSESDVVNVVGH